MFCKHEWALLSETVTKSKFEVAVGAMPDCVEKLSLPYRLSDATRKHIQAFQCKKCGKLKRFVEEI